MLQLSIRTSDGLVPVTKLLKINLKSSAIAALDATGTATESGGSVAVSANVLSWSEWYGLYIRAKYQAIRRAELDMETPVADTTSPRSSRGYYFVAGIHAYIVRYRSEDKPPCRYLRSVNYCTPQSGNLNIIGDSQISLYPNDSGELELACTVIPRNLLTLLRDIYYCTWRLYHAYNYLGARLLVHDPMREDHTYDEYPLGRCMGTLLEYQAQVACWNMYVWKKARSLTIEVINEKLAVRLGYINSECGVSGVRIRAKITIASDFSMHARALEELGIDIANIFTSEEEYNALSAEERSGKITAYAESHNVSEDNLTAVLDSPNAVKKALSALTMFYQGNSSNLGDFADSAGSASGNNEEIDGSAVVVQTYKEWEGATYELTGFGKDRYDGNWSAIYINIDIPAMAKGEYYENLYVLAVSVAGERFVDLNVDGPEKYTDMTVAVSWEVSYMPEFTVSSKPDSYTYWQSEEVTIPLVTS